MAIARQLNIDVTNTPKASTNSTAELTFGLVLSAARRIVKEINYAVQRVLMDGRHYFSVVEVCKTIGIISLRNW